MRIAYLLADPGIGVFGTKGASVHVQEVIRALRRLGHEVTVFCVRRDEEVPADLADLEVVTVGIGPSADAAGREVRIAEAGRGLAAAARAHGIPFDLVYERYALFSTAGAQLARSSGAPFVLEVNAPLVEEQRTHRVLCDESAALAATRLQFARARVLTCVSSQVAAWAARMCPEAAGRIVVVPNGVDVERIRPASARAGERAAFTVGFVGTLKPWHGTDVLLEAFALAREEAPAPQRAAVGSSDWRLDICGKGPELESLRARARALGIEAQVTFRGAVAPERVPGILGGFDAAVAPYPPGADYFSPLKVYEYMAAGLPVVASGVGELPGLLGEGERGLLVEPGDAAALADALGALASAPALRARLGSAARTAAVAEHSWEERCAVWLDRLPGAQDRGAGGQDRDAAAQHSRPAARPLLREAVAP
ncbi:glycosyltransferase family 4 protein [Brevibacterium album]|uniref:glycosyltransferase family 4 protein n=1 Tax=Brevibacterium album TaxID=417948 RepID=UPI0004002F69|nr:glycosyltransferase family 4 protein [Brevibacterium album]